MSAGAALGAMLSITFPVSLARRADLVDRVNVYYGDVKAEDFALHWQARLLFPRHCPD